MVLTMMTASLLMLLAITQNILKLKWLWHTIIAILILLIFKFENIYVHLTDSGLLTQNVWPVLVLYFHLYFFSSINEHKSESYLIVLLPFMMYFLNNPLVKVSILLAVSLLYSKKIEKISFINHSFGLILALLIYFMPGVEFLSICLYVLYLCYILYETYRLNYSNDFDLKCLIYLLLNCSVLSGAMKGVDVGLLNYVALLAVVGIVFKFKKERSKILPLTGILIIFYSVLTDIFELYQVLPIFCVLVDLLFNNREVYIKNGKNIIFELRNNMKVLCYLMAGFILIQSTISNNRAMLATNIVFWIYFFTIVTYEKKSSKIYKNDLVFATVFILDLAGVICLK